MGKKDRKRKANTTVAHAVPASDRDVVYHRINLACSGATAPAHLRADKGFAYPLEAERRCSATCPHSICVGYPPSLDRSDIHKVVDWTFDLAGSYKCHDALMETLNEFAADRLPNNVVVKPGYGEPDRKDVIAFFKTTDGKSVVPFELSQIFIPAQKAWARELPCVLHAERRAAFARLSHAIEEVSEKLPEGDYLELCNAAQAAFDQ